MLVGTPLLSAAVWLGTSAAAGVVASDEVDAATVVAEDDATDDATDADEDEDEDDDDDEERGPPDPAERRDRPWIQRWAPERRTLEVSLFGGVLVTAPRLAAFDSGRSDLAAVRPAPAAPDFGLRVGFYPLRRLGMELEGGAMPTRTSAGDPAMLWTARGQLVGRLARWSVTPLLLVGGGVLGVRSQPDVVGRRAGPLLHVGGGVQIMLGRRSMVRLDLRDAMAARRGGGVAHSAELLLSLGLAFGRPVEQPPPPPPDGDADGVLDPDDRCPAAPGPAERHGCPIPDSDRDGVLDPDDECPQQAGVAAYRGCPIPDSDGDGRLDPYDACPRQSGVDAYQGCPIPDADADGHLDPDDACVDEPETTNGFEDHDGCPDALPPDLAGVVGVVSGIDFAPGTAVLRRRSIRRIEEVHRVLAAYPEVKLRIRGHTEARGTPESDGTLGLQRAEAVARQLTEAGLDPSRVTTEGVGSAEPLADDAERSGRAKNERIEITLLPG